MPISCHFRDCEAPEQFDHHGAALYQVLDVYLLCFAAAAADDDDVGYCRRWMKLRTVYYRFTCLTMKSCLAVQTANYADTTYAVVFYTQTLSAVRMSALCIRQIFRFFRSVIGVLILAKSRQ